MIAAEDMEQLFFGRIRDWHGALLTAVIVVLVTIALSLAAGFTFQLIERKFHDTLGQSLNVGLDTLDQSMTEWGQHQLGFIRQVVAQPELVTAVDAFVRKEANDIAKVSSDIHALLSSALDPRIFPAFRIVNADFETIVTDFHANGTGFSLERGSVLSSMDQLARGAAFLVVGVESGNDADPARMSYPVRGALLLAAPIRDQTGTALANLLVQVNIDASLAKILRHGRLGLTGKSYAVDGRGYMVSESWFRHELVKFGFLRSDQSAVANIRVVDPGRLLEVSKTAAVQDADWPLTLMAARVTEGERGISLREYRDYRGVPVVGAWTWNKTLDLGIAIEQDASEALALLDLIAEICVVAVLMVLGLLVLGGLIRLDGRWSARATERELDSVAELSGEGIGLIDNLGYFIQANRALKALLGRSAVQLKPMKLSDVITPQSGPGSACEGEHTLVEAGRTELLQDKAKGTVVLQTTVQTLGGDKIPVQVTIRPLQQRYGHFVWICLFRDISAQIKAQKLLQQAHARELGAEQEKFRKVLENSVNGLMLVSRSGEILFSNDAAAEMLRATPAALRGRAFGIPVSTDTRSEIMIRRFDGSFGVAEALFTETEWEGDPAYLVVLNDVTLVREAVQEIEKLAYTDALTGLPNRNKLNQEINELISVLEARGFKELLLLSLDLDKFGEINFTLGQEVGDEVLRLVAERLLEVEGDNGFVAHVGGDEFYMLRAVSDEPSIDHYAFAVRERLNQPFEIDGHELYLGISIGGSRFPSSADSAATLVRQADAALNAAKRDHVGFVAYAEPIGKSSRLAATLDQNLHRAFVHHDFCMHYQVQVDLQDERPIAQEALVRWLNSDQAGTGPGVFIPAMERSGLIVPLGRWILESVCRQMNSWRSACPQTARKVAVNLSPVQLEIDQVATYVRGLLAEYALPPELLVIEITETAMLTGGKGAMKQLKILKDLGLELHLDDFGTGYSSLSMLKRLPFSVVKIDQSFVRNLDTDPANYGLTQAAISMARSLGMKTLAEGVETRSQLEKLRDLDCDYAQGYLFGRPQVPANQCALMGATSCTERVVCRHHRH